MMLVRATAIILLACMPVVAVADPMNKSGSGDESRRLPLITPVSQHSHHVLQDRKSLSFIHPLECVPYARRLSGIELYGDADTWWEQAAGQYSRGSTPEFDAVLTFRPARRSSGHVAVVTAVIDPRIILVSHANWLNKGRIHEKTPVLDVSSEGNWSEVRIWYAPGDTWGSAIYPTYGFIYAPPQVATYKSTFPR